MHQKGQKGDIDSLLIMYGSSPRHPLLPDCHASLMKNHLLCSTVQYMNDTRTLLLIIGESLINPCLPPSTSSHRINLIIAIINRLLILLLYP